MPGGDNPSPPSLLRVLQQDTPVVQDAAYEFDDDDRAYLDDQILALQQFVLQALLLNLNATWLRLDGGSAAVNAGQPVCAAATTSVGVTLATDAALGAAGLATGIAITNAAPGAMVLVAMAGVLPPSMTGLATGAAGPVKATAGTLVRVATIGAGDFPVGYVNAQGILTLRISQPSGFPTSAGRTIVNAAGGTTNLTGTGDIDVFADSTAVTANTINLPAAPSDGQRVRVRDVGDNASAKNITISGGAIPVDRLGTIGSIVITTNGASQDVEYSANKNKWFGV